MEYKKRFYDELRQLFEERELNSMWRILTEDIFRDHGYERFNEIIEELKQHKPLQYITEIEYFYGHKFYVNPSVLIPRPETEELVEWILNDHPEGNLTVMDIGTGSGCIPIAIKLARPNWKVIGMELSMPALEVARINAANLNANVGWLHGDMTIAADSPTDVDIIVCNPPYILPEDGELMTASVDAFEPHMALYTPPSDALHFYREVIRHGLQANKNVQFYFEIHHEFAPQMLELCKQHGLEHAELKNDMQGNARMVRAFSRA